MTLQALTHRPLGLAFGIIIVPSDPAVMLIDGRLSPSQTQAYFLLSDQTSKVYCTF
jgi:hypothetical protein